MRKLLRRVGYLFQRGRRERELEEEMRAHREMMGDAGQASFGSELRLREEAREAWGWNWLDELRQDLAYGARQLARSPGFALAAVVILALGVGLNLAVFHVVNAVFYSRIPVTDSEDLLRVIRQSPEQERWAFPPEMIGFFQDNADQFEYLVGEHLGSTAVTVEDDPESVAAQFVSGNYFDALALQPAQGRLLEPRDARAGAETVAVLGYGYWQDRWGSDAGIVGTSIEINGIPAVVVGVGPPEFTGLAMSPGQVWFPATVRDRVLGLEPSGDRFGRPDTAMIGKLKAGVSFEAGEAQLRALTGSLRAERPDLFDDDETVLARPLGQDQRDLGPYLFLMPLTLLVLLSSCANLGNMLLARGLTRTHEIGTRIAVGASRGRLVRQFMTENLLLTALGAAGGLVTGRVGARLLAAAFTGTPDLRFSTDWAVIGFAALLAIVSVLVFGLAPAFQTASRARRVTRSRQTLIAVQVAVSCVLLILSGLLTRSAGRQMTLAESGGYRSVVRVITNLDETNLTGPAARQRLEEIAGSLEQLPGALSAALVADAPLFGLRVENPPGVPATFWLDVDPGYFEVMQIPMLRGRTFERGEKDVVIVDERAARAVFPDEDPLGQIWNPEDRPGVTGPTVVGVAGHGVLAELRDPTAIEAYLPISDGEVAGAEVLLRVHGDPGPMLDEVREVATIPGLTPSVRVLDSDVEALTTHTRDATRLMGALGSVAALLAGIGIFGLLAFAVVERTREIGIRLALGAKPGGILRVLLSQFAKPLAIGAGAGVLLAAAGEQFVRGFAILGVEPFDALGYVLGLGAFALLALGAVAVPLRRALAIDAAAALRSE